jgi:hypothetical protein
MGASLFEHLRRLKEDPAMLAEWLRREVALPPFTSAHVEHALRERLSRSVAPPDLVVTFCDEAVSGARTVVFAAIVEGLSACESEKRFTWPFQAAALRHRLRCPVCVVVLTPDAVVERWARQPIHLGQPGSSFTPLVLGPPTVVPDDLDDLPDSKRALALWTMLRSGGSGEG